MENSQTALAKLAGIQKALTSILQDTAKGAYRGNRAQELFSPQEVESYFISTDKQLNVLRSDLDSLFGDFDRIKTEPDCEMTGDIPNHFRRRQLEYLSRTIDQIFELRAHSELAVPTKDIESKECL